MALRLPKGWAEEVISIGYKHIFIKRSLRRLDRSIRPNE